MYKDLLFEFTEKSANMCFSYDTDPNFTSIQETYSSQFLSVIKGTYSSIVKIWKLLEMNYFDAESLAINISPKEFSKFMSDVFGNDDLKEEDFG